jgi:hypothetical protein
MGHGRLLGVFAAVTLAAATLTACGQSKFDPNGSPAADRSDTTPFASDLPAPAPVEQADPSLDLPEGVPDRATGPADRASARTIRAWLRALNRGDMTKAATFFALPSKFQNGTPVLTIDTEIERLAVNESLTCGARAVRVGANGPYTIVTYRLQQRVGADCGTGAGQRARGVILVRAGRIREWYRLRDEAETAAPSQAEATPAGPLL